MGRRSCATRVGSPHSVHLSMTLETCNGIAFSITPPCRVWPCGRTCFFTILWPSTITLLTCGIARETTPSFPLSLPAIIKTVSPFLMFILTRWRGFFSFCFVAIYFLLEHFRRKRNNLHKIPFAQFSGHWTEDTCASWVVTCGNDDGCIFVKANM